MPVSRQRPRARTLASLALGAAVPLAAFGFAGRAGAASGGVFASGGLSASLAGATLTLACASAAPSGRIVRSARLAALALEASDARADATLGYLAGTALPYRSASLHESTVVYHLSDVRIDDRASGSGAGAWSSPFGISAASVDVSLPKFPTDEGAAALLESAATAPPSPTPAASVPPGTSPPRGQPRAKATPAPMLIVAGVGAFSVAASTGAELAADQPSLGAVSLSGESALRFVAPCFAGNVLHGLAWQTAHGRAAFASARLARITQTFDRSGSLLTEIRFDGLERVASPRAGATQPP